MSLADFLKEELVDDTVFLCVPDILRRLFFGVGIHDEGYLAVGTRRLHLVPQLHPFTEQPGRIGGDFHYKNKRFVHSAQFDSILRGLCTNHVDIIARILESGRYGIGEQK